MRWAVFKDQRGVAYCEPVDDGILVFTMQVSPCEQKRHWLTKRITRPAVHTKTLFHIRLNPNHYSPKRFHAGAFEAPPPGYTYSEYHVYLQENLWGLREAILIIKDDKLGRRMQYEFRKMAPEKELFDLTKRRSTGAPHPATDRLIEKLRELV